MVPIMPVVLGRLRLPASVLSKLESEGRIYGQRLLLICTYYTCTLNMSCTFNMYVYF